MDKGKEKKYAAWAIGGGLTAAGVYALYDWSVLYGSGELSGPYFPFLLSEGPAPGGNIQVQEAINVIPALVMLIAGIVILWKYGT